MVENLSKWALYGDPDNPDETSLPVPPTDTPVENIPDTSTAESDPCASIRRKLDAWWKEKLTVEKVAVLYKFKRALKHEIDEAIISLDREGPNINMAL